MQLIIPSYSYIFSIFQHEKSYVIYTSSFSTSINLGGKYLQLPGIRWLSQMRFQTACAQFQDCSEIPPIAHQIRSLDDERCECAIQKVREVYYLNGL